MKKIMTIFGTRPEAIKMAPVIKELEKHPKEIECLVCVTAQHRKMLDQVLSLFNIIPDVDLNLMENNQTLGTLTSRVVSSLDEMFNTIRPDWVLIQGDTTTTMAASLAAFYHGIRIGHVEAGLRSHEKRSAFPEEINRKIVSIIADLHFAPTDKAMTALMNEGVLCKQIFVTGNTVIDAMLSILENVRKKGPRIPVDISPDVFKGRIILVTGHRRESFGKSFEEMCYALKTIVELNDDIYIIYPVHMNPQVQNPVRNILGNNGRINLLEPLSYDQLVWLMDNCFMILTDSGGIQEEAPSLGKPVLVMRDVTEREEGILCGCSRLVGTNRDRIINEAQKLINIPSEYNKMAKIDNPYGDGQASRRIVDALLSTI